MNKKTIEQIETNVPSEKAKNRHPEVEVYSKTKLKFQAVVNTFLDLQFVTKVTHILLTLSFSCQLLYKKCKVLFIPDNYTT